MSQITAGTGLISGIDIQGLVDKLMQLEARPRALMADRQAQVDAQRTAIMDLSSLLLALKLKTISLRAANQLSAAKAVSSNENILAATAANGATPASYQFNVARLVSTQHLLSAGYENPAATGVFAPGTITVNSDQARLTDDLSLDLLNAQHGVRRGAVRITDRSGASALVDLSTALTAGDVVDAINASGLNIQAAASGGRLVITDLTGQSASNLIVTEVNAGHAAADLGILKSVAADTLTGDDLVSVDADTHLNVLNNAMGVRQVLGADDFRITLKDSTQLDINIDSAKTLGDVLDAVNNAAGNGGKLVAAIDPAADGLTLTDTTAGAGTLAVTALGSSRAAFDLGILASDADADAVIHGSALLAGLQDVLLSRLNGASGVTRGTISITDRNGATSQIDLAAANSIQDVLSAINDPGVTADVTAALNASGSGIVITDNTAGAGNLVIADVSGSLAADLNIDVDAAVSQVASGDLNRAFLSGASRLDALNGGAGVARGTFRITNSIGASSVVDLTPAGVQTLQDVIDAVNASGLNVTATINATGDGLLLTDAAGGGALLTVADVSGSAAADLNILGSAPAGTTTIDGSREVAVEVTAADSLNSLVTRLNDAGAGLRATLINDGSATAPYRLSLVAERPAAAGALLVDTGATALNLAEMVHGKPAVLRIGGATGQSLLLASNSNTVTGVINKVTLDLKSADPAQTVTVSISSDPAAVVAALNSMVTDLNTVLTKIATYTRYDADKQQGAILQGDGNVILAQARIQGLIFRKFSTGARYETLSAVGFAYKDGQIQLDADKFAAAFAAHPDDVQKLLQDPNGSLAAMQDVLGGLAQVGSGSLAIEATRLQSESDMYAARLAEMDKLLESKRQRLTNSFIYMEEALAKLQSQQTALTTLANLAASMENQNSTSSSG